MFLLIKIRISNQINCIYENETNCTKSFILYLQTIVTELKCLFLQIFNRNNFIITAVQRGRQTVTSRYSPYNNSNSNNNKLSQQQTQQQNEASTNIISEFLTTTTAISSPSVQSNFTIDAASNNFGTKGINYLLNIIQWAKSNSFFPALTVSDQAALLKLSWKDLFVLSLSEPTSSSPIQLMDIVRDSSIAHDETFISYVKSFQRHLDTLTSLQLDPAETACLKALILFTPGNYQPLTSIFALNFVNDICKNYL